MEFDAEIDCEGLLCPLPVLRARKRLASMAPGAVLRVRATDAMAAIDLPHFCA
jgi:tRNA 2-thiouridine synthesizing protein A